MIVPVAILLVVGMHALPADAHFLAEGAVTQDGFVGKCRVDAMYATFGNGFAQVVLYPESDMCDWDGSWVEVITAVPGGVNSRRCNWGAAIDHSTSSCLVTLAPGGVTFRAVATGYAFSMATKVRTTDGLESVETHGAFG
jgi:hypothetical protein